jgi:hypothetical protein
MNGGSCQVQGNNYICVCPQYYSGTNCEICKLIFVLEFYLKSMKTLIKSKKI